MIIKYDPPSAVSWVEVDAEGVPLSERQIFEKVLASDLKAEISTKSYIAVCSARVLKTRNPQMELIIETNMGEKIEVSEVGDVPEWDWYDCLLEATLGEIARARSARAKARRGLS